ncbi:hypothetical protein ACIBW9_11480 [Streptomyces sp. NPDC049541]|uniref:hypothetical protein n=1 Tax=Streptomyces sp. NPDC049541 TaxID=3365594 RepID=UPI0037A63A4C
MRAGAGLSLAQPARRTPARRSTSTPRTDSGRVDRVCGEKTGRAARAFSAVRLFRQTSGLRVDGVGEDTGSSRLDKLRGGGRRFGCCEHLPSRRR